MDTFSQNLYRLAENCDHSTVKEDLIRDRNEVGVVIPIGFSQKQCLQMSRQAESTSQDGDFVCGDNKPAQVKFVSSIKNEHRKLLSKEPPKPVPSCGWYNRERHTDNFAPQRMLAVTNVEREGIFEVCVAARAT